MVFKRKMILAYATICFLISVALGVLVYRTSSSYERKSVRSSLSVAARSYVSQMEDRLERMDAIISYILSNPDILEDITLLSKEGKVSIPPLYLREAKEEIRIGISTEYIIENSFRTVFVKEGFLASSSVKAFSEEDSKARKLKEEFSLEEIPYIQKVSQADGRTVLIGPHEDTWGAYGGVQVFSVMKAIRGEDMGFIEVENRLDSLAALTWGDPDTGFAIRTQEGEILYLSQEGKGLRDILSSLPEKEAFQQGEFLLAQAASEKFGFSAVAFWPVELLRQGERRIFLTSFLAALLAFGASLAIIIIWSNHLTRPMQRLQEIVEETNIENLEEKGRFPLGVGEMDEFEGLARAFDRMTSRLNQALTNERRAEMLQLQAQFDVLQTQVNPHFLYNVLNIISSRGILADDEVICEMCGCLGNMLRYSTNNKDRYASVADELEYLHSYFYLLKCRYESRLKVKVQIEEDVKGKIIPKMTLQQIVENCVKHGFHDTDVDMEITIQGWMVGDGWRISVRDNGVGIPSQELERIRERLSQVRRSYLDHAVQTEGEIGGMGLVTTYARCLLLYNSSLVFEVENVTGPDGCEVLIGEA